MKELLIFLGGAMCGSFFSFLLFCAITISKSKDNEYRNGDQYLCSKENYAQNAKQVNIHTSLTDVPRCALISAATAERNALCMSSWKNRKKVAFGNVYLEMVKVTPPENRSCAVIQSLLRYVYAQFQKTSKKLVYIAEIPVSILNIALNYGKIYIQISKEWSSLWNNNDNKIRRTMI